MITPECEGKRGWLSLFLPGGHKHVIPCGDLIEHEESEDCVCVPEVTVYLEADSGFCVSHASLDGRELAE